MATPAAAAAAKAPNQTLFAEPELLEVMVDRARAEHPSAEPSDSGDVDDDARRLHDEDDAEHREKPDEMQLRGERDDSAAERERSRVAHEDACGKPVEEQECRKGAREGRRKNGNPKLVARDRDDRNADQHQR